MTRRERVMGLCVAGAIGCVALVEGVKYVVVRPFQNVDQSIRDQQSLTTRLKERQAALQDVEQRWAALTRRTLATDSNEAGRRFQKDLNELAELHGLRNPKTTPGKPSAFLKTGIINVPVTLSAECTLKDALGFLNDFYRRNYIARLDKVTLSMENSVIESVNSARRQRSTAAASTRNRGRRGGNNAAATPESAPAPAAARNDVVIGPDGPLLKINVIAVTLILPEIKGIEHEVADALKAGDGRLPRPLPAYTEILDKSLFKPYLPPAPPVKPPDPVIANPEGPKETPESKREPPLPVRPTNFVVTCTTAVDGKPVAYILDNDAKDSTEALRRFYEDEPFDDGTLLLIHNDGLVVRVQEGRRTKDYFYPLGGSFADREDLNRDAHPDIWQAMDDEFFNWDGEPGGLFGSTVTPR